ncbi:hypothetical protein LB553_21970 [Mesorhizobium sp. CA8]|uniref:hypothetical protein n=1 Tax=Mesorhizobium sp. CA8 TaxID=2876637 RepID=UPI001CCD0A32|nr:hypothetical protein [Mesorhizobium sp. CA8]MBZ9763526.1 hypothetical protein [Mesorhizobium sp. CA8]
MSDIWRMEKRVPLFEGSKVEKRRIRKIIGLMHRTEVCSGSGTTTASKQRLKARRLNPFQRDAL